MDRIHGFSNFRSSIVTDNNQSMALIRIQKFIAEAGIASRRKAEELILEGRVIVNGKPATIGMKIDPHRDHVRIDGRLIKKTEKKVYIIFNKPRRVITSLTDPQGRDTVMNYLNGVKERVYPVGRLDYDSEGLLLLTNDGELAYSILHPSRQIPKTYLVKVHGIISDNDIKRLEGGVMLNDGITAPAKVRILKETENNTWLEITIYEGRKRQLRRMLEKIGHPVMRLRRIAIDGIKLSNLKPGQWRYLTHDELKRLKEYISPE